MYRKSEILKEYLRSLGSVAVAFSGGVDSTYLMKVAHEVLGDKAVAVTVRSASFPEREFGEAQRFCADENIKQVIVYNDELSIDGFAQNPKDRCYICKKEIFKNMRRAIAELGIENIAEGSNTDDEGDYRPGLRAVAEMDIKSPLRYAGLNKQEIRQLSKEMGIKNWDKPSFACLASRFVYGELITKEKLEMVDRAEQFLLDLGFGQVRVRIHDRSGRIEVLPDEFIKLIDNAEAVCTKLKELGFSYVSMDLGGYKTGNMNIGVV